MSNEKIQLFTSIGDLERVNERFAKVKIRIAYEGENRNKSYISKETFEKAIPTLKYVPVVGYYMEHEKMFDGHTEKLEIIDDEITLKTLTKPYGVVTDEKPFWEDVKTTNGEVKSYLTCYAMLWIARYPELEGIKEGDFAQSMEIMCNKGYWSEEDGLYHIEDLTFDALCILQAKEPCFEDSIITLNFSKGKFEDEYKSMITELKEYTFSLLEKGGVEVEDNKELETVETMKVEETPIVEEQVEETVTEAVVEETETVVEEEFAKKKKCEDETDEDEVENPKKEEDKSEEEDDFEKKKKCEQEDYEAKYNEAITELNELKAKYVDLEATYTALNEEVVGLREFKSDIETKEHQAEVDAMLEKYSELEDVQGYDEVIKDKYSMEIDKLETAIKVFAFDNGVVLGKKTKKNFAKKDTTIVFEKDTVETTIKESAWDDVLGKYVSK